MGLTLIAILTAALLLPGIVAARAYYFSASTNEIEVPTPPLSTSDGIALVGFFSVAVHLIYIVGLWVVSQINPVTLLPLANPYTFFSNDGHAIGSLGGAYKLFSGLTLLCVAAATIGFLAGKTMLRRNDRSSFYGPLTDVLRSAQGDNTFIVAYVISKISHDNKLLGYQGTVVSLFRDEDRYPSKVILKDVAPFYLEMADNKVTRHEAEEAIDWISLKSEDWHNIAFRVFRFENDA